MNTKIYCLCDENNQIRYIGKTVQSLEQRFNDHLKAGRLKARTYKNNWINSMLRKGLIPNIQLIGEIEGDGIKEEIGYIAYGFAVGWKLTNGNAGGFGGKPTEATLVKLRIAAKGNKRFQNNHHTKATKELCSIAGKKYWNKWHKEHKVKA